MAGRKQHFLAAAYLAGFSGAPKTPKRESPIWVGRRGVSEPYQQRCEAVAYRKDLYTLGEPAIVGEEGGQENLALIDEAWSWVEQNVGAGIDALVSSCRAPIPAKLWLSVLVPFAAQVFVRGADWIPRFGSRFDWMEKHDQELHGHATSPDSANLSRFMELQRITPATLAARWQVLHCPSDSDLIVNDLGRVAMAHSGGMQGYTIPLNRRAALALLRAERGCRVIWGEDKQSWFVDGIEHFDLTAADVEGLNASLRDSAMVECFGPDPELVRIDPNSTPCDPADDPLLEPHLIVPSPAWLRARELDWAKMLTIVSKPPQGPEDDQPWCVMADFQPNENHARLKLQKLFVGDDAKWPAANSEAPGLLRRLAAWGKSRIRK